MKHINRFDITDVIQTIKDICHITDEYKTSTRIRVVFRKKSSFRKD